VTALSKRQRILFIGFFLLAALAVVAFYSLQENMDDDSKVQSCATDTTALISPLFHKTVENVSLKMLNGQPAMLYDFRGRYLTAIVFCSYKCPCSNGYIARLHTMREIYSHRGVSFLAINANSDETLDGMKQYINTRNYPLPVCRDNDGIAADLLHATITPEVFIFDTKWKLQYHGRIDNDKSGLFITDSSMRNALDTLLTGKELRIKEKLSLGCAIVR